MNSFDSTDFEENNGSYTKYPVAQTGIVRNDALSGKKLEQFVLLKII